MANYKFIEVSNIQRTFWQARMATYKFVEVSNIQRTTLHAKMANYKIKFQVLNELSDQQDGNL